MLVLFHDLPNERAVEIVSVEGQVVFIYLVIRA
jgi:hypothetical protein